MTSHGGGIRVRAVAIYGVTNALCVVILVWALQLWRADLSALLTDASGDALFYATIVKSLANGWFLTNPQLGAPFDFLLHEFPMTESLHYALLKGILWLSGDPIVAMNAYYLLSFPLAASSALFVMRRFGVSAPAAVVGSLLFAFAPYHFWRGEQHLIRSAYYIVPLMVMVILQLCAGESILLAGRRHGARRRWVVPVAICLTMAANGVYDAFFSAVFLLIAGVYAAVRGGGWRAVASATLLAGVLFAGVATILLPTLVYVAEHGHNPGVAQRGPGEAEVYGLKIADLLLPVDGHRLPIAAELKARYTHTALAVNENASASLGAIGSLAFLALLARQLFGRRRAPHADLLDALAVLALAGVLFGTIGGFGSLFAQFVTPQIRAYNRISIFLSFFSLFAASAFLDRLGPATGRAQARDPVFLGVCAGVLVLGLLDQVSPVLVPAYEQLQATHADEAGFMREVEAALPPNAMVFQLPFVSFPEGDTPLRMVVYAHLRAYLYSHALRFSFPTMRGREGDAWQREVSELPPPAMVARLAQAGFRGIYVDRTGYADPPAAIEGPLRAILGPPAIVSSSKQLSFFAIPDSAVSASRDRAPEPADDRNR